VHSLSWKTLERNGTYAEIAQVISDILALFWPTPIESIILWRLQAFWLYACLLWKIPLAENNFGMDQQYESSERCEDWHVLIGCFLLSSYRHSSIDIPYKHDVL
jgi:hypothetical protein